MYDFFSNPYNNTAVEPANDSTSLSNWELAGIVVGAVVLLGCSICCGLILYRRCQGENPTVAPENTITPPTQNKNVLIVVRNSQGGVLYEERRYPDGSVLVLDPNSPEISEKSEVNEEAELSIISLNH